MGLTGDFDELKKDWKKYPIWVKAILFMSFFITVSSITSLSDVIFQWKGFIRDGMEFYRNYIANNVQKMFSALGIDYSDRFIDFYTVYSLLLIGPLANTTFYAKWPHTDNPRKLRAYKKYNTVMIYNLIGIAVFPLVTFAIRPFQWDWNVWVTLMVYGVTVISFTKLKKSLFSSIAPSIFAIVLVLVLAAINSGWNR